MTTFTFESETEDGTPRLLAGTWRPPTLTPTLVSEWAGQRGFLGYSSDDARRAWHEGYFDRPIYVLDEK